MGHTLKAQDFNFQRTNYTIEDGLPSNECHRVLQDDEGYIWIATDRGLVKYDGYEFRTYGIKDGLLDISCLGLKMDVNGQLWARTLSNKFFLYNSNSDSFINYQHQQTLDPYIKQLRVLDFHIDSMMNLACAVEGIGFLIISNDGTPSLERDSRKEGMAPYLTKSFNTDILISSNDRGAAPDFPLVNMNRDSNEISSERFEIVYNDEVVIDIPYSLIKNTVFKGIRLSDKNSVLSLGGLGLFFQDEKYLSKRDAAITSVIQYGNSFISCEIQNKGVKFFQNYSNLTKDIYFKRIAHISASDILKDRNDDLWISTLSNGLIYLKQNEISQIRPAGIRSEIISGVASGPQGLYFLENKTRLYYLENKESAVELYYDPESELRHLDYSKAFNELVLSKRHSGRINHSHEFMPIYHSYPTNQGQRITGLTNSNRALCFDDDFILINATSFLQYRNLDSLQIYYPDMVENDIRVLSGVKLAPDDFLLGTNSGLVSFRGKEISKTNNLPTELRARINDIKQLDNTFIFATQGYGLVFWDLSKELTILDKKNGLLSDNIEDVFIDSKKNVFVSSNSGLTKLWFDENDSIIIKSYTTFHGLPSNEVNNVAEHNDTIYIATGKGIGVLSDSPSFVEKQIIEIINRKANGQPIEDINRFSHSENNLQIEYKTVDFSMLSKIPYRYRLDENEWTNTNATNTTFPALQPGSYSFQVQSQNIDGIWSDSATWDFEIAQPWWRTTAFYFLSGFSFMGLVFLFYKYRTRQLKDQLKVESEIRELERSALQAQMNPHFIFNCLNSIQRFIMENDKMQAMDYLAKFAKLIRQSLNASAQNKISLQEEITMLQNYLELEKLRFKEKFDFKIKVDEKLNPEEVSLPPLLVQPYVENAVIHGMKQKVSGGLITISLRKNNPKELEIVVTDNGVVRQEPGSTEHKSLGMSITSQRIAYNNNVIGKTLQINPEYTDAGTTVRITLKV